MISIIYGRLILWVIVQMEIKVQMSFTELKLAANDTLRAGDIGSREAVSQTMSASRAEEWE